MPHADLPDFRTPPTKRDEKWVGDHAVTVCLGDRCLHGRLRRVIRGLNTEPIFTLAFALADIAQATPDLVSVVRVYTMGEPSAPVLASLIFTGYTERLAWDGDEAVVEASPMVGLKTRRLGGLSVFGIGPGELFWTFARIGGFSPSEIKIGDVWPPPIEDFFVVVPIEGVELQLPEQVGDVLFTPDPGLRRQWRAGISRQTAGPDYVAEFRGTSVAAVTTVRAALVIEAERIGFSRIEAAASRLALVSRHTLPLGVDRKPRPFGRERLQERVHVRRVVGVLSKNSQRQWIRGVDTSQDEVAVTSDTLSGMRESLGAPLDARTAEAVRAWRRAASAAEPASAVVALAEALEFYAAETKVSPLFSKEDLALARELAQAETSWSELQRTRLADALSRLNDAPFFVRLRAAVQRDGLELTRGESELLRQMRTQRNDLLHGRERADPDPDPLTAAIALVGRLLTYRLSHLREASDNESTRGIRLS